MTAARTASRSCRHAVSVPAGATPSISADRSSTSAATSSPRRSATGGSGRAARRKAVSYAHDPGYDGLTRRHAEQARPDDHLHLRSAGSQAGRHRGAHSSGLGGVQREPPGPRGEGLRGGGGRILGSVAGEAQTARRRASGRRGRLSTASPLLGGPLTSEAGAEDPRPQQRPFEPDDDLYGVPAAKPAGDDETEDPRALRELIPKPDTSRQIDDWGRSERVFQLMEPLLNFYYRYWFRVEQEGIENIPSEGGALLVANHSGALPPDGPMIMQAIRNEHPNPRPLYMLGEPWLKGHPGVGLLATKLGHAAPH